MTDDEKERARLLARAGMSVCGVCGNSSQACRCELNHLRCVMEEVEAENVARDVSRYIERTE
jgi:hypothetical protein